ncbi:hypothetical protein M409DRAFT_16558 [Zasmidium cellare ATCC 36951]|uniref:Enoyl reductase (ER) domain-containing protein n=1 Tax=Zasmidium cellare ATCC 36951 TaxID=1080233 RepID=A0A6A6CZM4_ZASCE|nr:uncharacterized protein M409DRAFT_16558 [Zasmidium cellare ATCC 36951]KAF2172594.1 hypothetical protein M409DRAFT_16558 [Zasmidium cellare ATCC 36951]
MGKHIAALAPEKQQTLALQERDTPEPGPNEILVEVKALAFNPVDFYQRDFGFPPVPAYPAVFGSDVAGIVTKRGSNVNGGSPPPGSRVVAFASSFYQNGNPNYGAFQRYVLAQAEGVTALPENISFEQGASLPLAVLTALTAYTTVGIPLSTRHTPEDKQAIIIWGAASSVGTLAVQSAKSLGFTVYATASAKNHSYIKELGADHVFDYSDSNVAASMIEQIKKDGVKMQTAHVVCTGGLEPTLEILKATKDSSVPAKVSHSPLLPEDHPTLDNTEIKFNFPSMDKEVRDAHIADSFQGWLADGLKAGTVVPSPPVEVVGQGFESVNKALDAVKAGVSCKKIAISI